MFNFIKNKLQTIYSSITSQVSDLFSRQKIDEEALKELELILLQADTGVKTTNTILNNLKSAVQKGTLQTGLDLKKILQEQLISLLQTPQSAQQSNIIMLVGVNGTGKTTCAAKLAHDYIKQNKKVLLVAGDTFRAAATQQLQQWADKLDADIIIGKENQDPASVIFAACDKYKKEHYDVLIIDTAGRLQTKTNLMAELEKIKRVATKQLPDQSITTLLTVDAMLGQNSLQQAQLFHESTQLDGVVLTKMDGTGKGGIVFAISQELQVPIIYLSFGESAEHLKLFKADEYVQELLDN